MTDEQWLWLFANQVIDNDIKLERMCQKCRDEVVAGNKCSRCGRDTHNDAEFVNPNFDKERFAKLSEGSE